MSYTALYRKFRPAEFEDVKGQDHIVTTLKNQIRSGRIGHAICSAGRGEPERRRWRKFLPGRSTASIRWTAVHAENVICAVISHPAHI